MRIPPESPVMTLANATLLPGTLMPLYIFEPRYRRMLDEALHSHRMFSVALQQPDCKRESPSLIAGLGLIRAAIGRPDGTSHVILQGLARVELAGRVRSRPFRVHRIKPLASPPCDNVRADALAAKVRELVERRIHLGLPFSSPAGRLDSSLGFPPDEFLAYLDSLPEPAHLADAVSGAVLPWALDRQAILETVDVEARLRRLIGFLLAEVHPPRRRLGP